MRGLPTGGGNTDAVIMACAPRWPATGFRAVSSMRPEGRTQCLVGAGQVTGILK
jgi:hypothetical protein